MITYLDVRDIIFLKEVRYTQDGRKQKGEECPRWVNKEIPELFDYYCDGVSTMELAEMFNTNKSMINKIIRYKFKELWQGRK